MRIRLFLLICALMAALGAWAENVKITGMVTDENNEPLEFVSIRMGGTMTGATSGLDGKYELNVVAADTIKVIFT